MPYKVCFLTNKKSIYWVLFDTFIDMIFIGDIFITLNTPFVDEKRKKVIISRKTIFMTYLKSWFFIDILSSIPMDLVEYYLIPANDDGFDNDVLKLIKIPRIYRIMRVARIYRVFKLFKNMALITSIKESLNLKVGSQRLI